MRAEASLIDAILQRLDRIVWTEQNDGESCKAVFPYATPISELDLLAPNTAYINPLHHRNFSFAQHI